MKPLTKQILQLGIIDKFTVELLEQWGSLDYGAPSCQEATGKSLRSMVDEIERLVDSPQKNETRLDFLATEETTLHDENGSVLKGWVDHMGYLIIPMTCTFLFNRGSKLVEFRPGRTPTTWEVLDIDPIYRDDQLVAFQLRV